MSAVIELLEKKEAEARARMVASTGASSVFAYEDWRRIAEQLHLETTSRQTLTQGVREDADI